ncbi:MAG: fluoride efflux transporter CrcB [Planctomycetota bacterium]
MTESYAVKLLAITAGGAVGSGLRFMLHAWVNRLAPIPHFPWGTLAVNGLGCLLIGVLAGLVDERQLLTPTTRLVLIVGVLGGFTTFSTFAYDTLTLARDHAWSHALGNVTLQVGVGLAAVWVGYAIARLF